SSKSFIGSPLKFVDPSSSRSGQNFDLGRRVVCCPECILYLGCVQLMKLIIKPAPLCDGYIVEQTPTLGARRGENNVAILNTLDEFCFAPCVRLIVGSSQS